MLLQEGSTFEGYTIQRRLGVGGMGEVYLVRHSQLERLEALKILRADLGSEDEDFQSRFFREIKLAASLNHPNIVRVHHAGEHDGRLWMSMDFVDGTDCAQLLRDKHPGGLPAQDVIEIVWAIAEALDYAHRRNLLHRDVKPANILLSTDADTGGRSALLADFGIARTLDEQLGSLTATNMVVGTLIYAAPEQLEGKDLDGRTDQYALAATAFHLFTGRAALADSNAAMTIARRLREPPPLLSGSNPSLSQYDSVLNRALAIDPDQRYGSCRQFAAALADCAAGSSPGPGSAVHGDPTQFNAAVHMPPTQVGAKRPPRPAAAAAVRPAPPKSSGTSSSRHTPMIAAAIGAALVAIPAAGTAIWLSRGTPSPATPASTDTNAAKYTRISTTIEADQSSSAPAPAPRTALPGADAQGFTAYGQGGRCTYRDRAEFILRTDQSAVVICKSPDGARSYHGLRLSDRAQIWLLNPDNDGQVWTVTNPADGTLYRASASGLQIINNAVTLTDEPAVESLAPSSSAPMPTISSPRQLPASGGNYVAVSTTSGKTTCEVTATWVGCQANTANWPIQPSGYKANGARITNTGNFDWVVGDLGDISGITTMDYSQTYSALGWTIEPNKAGTRFTNQSTGHGMLVNTEQVAHF